MSASYICPHNESASIKGPCCISECPYHMMRVKDIFDIPAGETNCAFYDTDLMQNVSTNRTQISALSRHPQRRLSPKLIRGTYENSVEQARTLHALTHSITPNRNYCKHCGYPSKGFECVSTDLCKTRKEWAKFICSQYKIEPSIIKYQNIWSCLLKNEIFANETTLKTGITLCAARDVQGNPNIPQEWLQPG